VVATGEAVLLLELTLSAGARSEPHRHDHESVCYLLRGRVRTTVGDDSLELGPGEACRHAIGVLHSVEALEDSLMLEIKSPPPDPDRLFELGD
jgi:quercetin dioxygenase-like cupin family protein